MTKRNKFEVGEIKWNKIVNFFSFISMNKNKLHKNV